MDVHAVNARIIDEFRANQGRGTQGGAGLKYDSRGPCLSGPAADGRAMSPYVAYTSAGLGPWATTGGDGGADPWVFGLAARLDDVGCGRPDYKAHWPFRTPGIPV